MRWKKELCASLDKPGQEVRISTYSRISRIGEA
jgi:hypothetical protein